MVRDYEPSEAKKQLQDAGWGRTHPAAAAAVLCTVDTDRAVAD